MVRTDCTRMECSECGTQKEIPSRGARTQYPCYNCGGVETFERLDTATERKVEYQSDSCNRCGKTDVEYEHCNECLRRIKIGR